MTHKQRLKYANKQVLRIHDKTNYKDWSRTICQLAKETAEYIPTRRYH